MWHQGQHGLWVIDPIDGTTNFANGIPFFGVAVAYLVDHKTQLGVVYNPVTDEAFYAGAAPAPWLNDVPLPLRNPTTTLRDAVAGVDFNASATTWATSSRCARPLFPAQPAPAPSSGATWPPAGLDVIHGGPDAVGLRRRPPDPRRSRRQLQQAWAAPSPPGRPSSAR